MIYDFTSRRAPGRDIDDKKQSQAFQLAGARMAVPSLWKIPDPETTGIMKAFFDNLVAKAGQG